jgi:Putative auto-transporter adhesin, head GIN domain
MLANSISRRENLQLGLGGMALLTGVLGMRSARAASRSWSLAACKSLVVNVPCVLKVEFGSTEQMQISAEPAVLEVLSLSNVGGVATLDSVRSFSTKKAVVVTATMSAMNSLRLRTSVQGAMGAIQTDQLTLDLDGASSVAVVGLRAKELTVHLNGASSLSAQGDALLQTYRIEGAGTVASRKLRGAQVKVFVNGSGNLEVSAKDTLWVEVNGVGTVGYEGKPKVVKSIQGFASVDPLS